METWKYCNLEPSGTGESKQSDQTGLKKSWRTKGVN